MAVREIKVPLNGAVYARKGKQYQGEKKGWRDVIFYLRCINRQRPFYENGVKKHNRLFLLGIWDPVEHSLENLPYEWAYSAGEDQAAMFEHILKNIVKLEERKRFVTEILGIIDQYGKQIQLRTEKDQ